MFLQEAGILNRMLADVTFEDTDNLERTKKLLINAAEVKVTGFLKQSSEKPAVLFTALSILGKTGERKYIADYASKVFKSREALEENIWKEAVDCISKRGSEAAVSVLLNELKKVRYDKAKAEYILVKLPVKTDHLTFPVLLELLEDSSFESGDILIEALYKIPEDIVIPELFRILKGGREKYSHSVRITTLKVLATFKLPYCVQPIIEQLPILPVEEAKDFSLLLSEFAGEVFSKRIGELLIQPDAKTRAAVISCIPLSVKKNLLKKYMKVLKMQTLM